MADLEVPVWRNRGLHVRAQGLSDRADERTRTADPNLITSDQSRVAEDCNSRISKPASLLRVAACWNRTAFPMVSEWHQEFVDCALLFPSQTRAALRNLQLTRSALRAMFPSHARTRLASAAHGTIYTSQSRVHID